MHECEPTASTSIRLCLCVYEPAWVLKKLTTYAGLRVAPHDSCDDHYDSYFSLCVTPSPTVYFVGRVVAAASSGVYFEIGL